jgi:hypothetical protein
MRGKSSEPSDFANAISGTDQVFDVLGEHRCFTSRIAAQPRNNKKSRREAKESEAMPSITGIPHSRYEVWMPLEQFGSSG